MVENKKKFEEFHRSHAEKQKHDKGIDIEDLRPKKVLRASKVF